MRHLLLASLLGASILQNPSRADDWPQWLGPQRDSVYREEGVVDRIPKQGLKVKWRAPVALVILAKLSPQGYEELGRFHVLEPTNTVFGRPVVWSHPAFAERCCFARNDKEIVCVSLALSEETR